MTNDPDYDRIARLWEDLSCARMREPFDIRRLCENPWESDDPPVKDKWLLLTDAGNLAALIKWSQIGPMNPVAQAATEEAIRQARMRAGLGPIAGGTEVPPLQF